jgi:hypothetical protein
MTLIATGTHRLLAPANAGSFVLSHDSSHDLNHGATHVIYQAVLTLGQA